MKTKFALVALFIAVGACSVSCRGRGAVQVAQFSERSDALPVAITVLNWNVEKGTNPQLVSDLQEIIERERPQLVFLQEASADLLESAQMGGYFAESWSYPWPGSEGTGVLSLSQVPPARLEPVQSEHREFGIITPKVSLVSEYPMANGQSVLALNVHLMNFERWSVRKIRHQLEALQSIMAEHSGPIVMVGDFNTWNQERLDLVQQITKDAGLSEVTAFPQGRRTGDTGSDFWDAVLGVDKGLPLDRIFVRGFKPLSARVLNYESSDHRPILVTLELQDSGADRQR